MREYYITDADGKKRVVEQDNGLIIYYLEEPSPEYIAAMPEPVPMPEGRDYLAEIDQLKAEVEELKRR